MAGPFLIYGLIDPRTLLIRYIGKSSDGLKRPSQHRYCRVTSTGPYCVHWIRSLQKDNLIYEITILENCDREGLSSCERYWIAFGLACGWPLTNLTAGGDGFTGKHSEKTRAKMSESGKKRPRRTAETRKKLAEAMRVRMSRPENRKALADRIFTPEWRAKISAKRLGHVKSEEEIAKIRASRRASSRTKLTLETAREAVIALRAGVSPRLIGLRFKVSRSAIEKIRDGNTWKDAW